MVPPSVPEIVLRTGETMVSKTERARSLGDCCHGEVHNFLVDEFDLLIEVKRDFLPN